MFRIALERKDTHPCSFHHALLHFALGSTCNVLLILHLSAFCNGSCFKKRSIPVKNVVITLHLEASVVIGELVGL